jgi:hypothetical protein
MTAEADPFPAAAACTGKAVKIIRSIPIIAANRFII